MTITIILIIIILIGIYLIKIGEWDHREAIGLMITVIFGIYLITHLILWAASSYTYDLWVLERNAFVETLKESREQGNELEAAAIIKEVSEWNKSLAVSKYENTLFLTKDYIDDRVKDLKPIK